MSSHDARYRALFDSIDQGFCIVEMLFDEHGQPCDYRFLELNDAFVQHTGLVDAEGRRMRELAPDHESYWFQAYGAVVLTGDPVRFQQRAAALRRWFDVYAFRIDRPELRRVGVLFRDITHQTQAQEALRASEARYRALASATANSLYRVSADGTQLLEVFGGARVSPAVSEGLTTAWGHDQIHPDEREAVLRAWQAAVHSGTTFEIEHRAVREDGSWQWVLSRAVPVHDDTGAIIEWMGSATDISARKQAEEALRESEAAQRAARAEAEHANRTKDEFLAMVGHELRNPLSPMLTALQLLRLRGVQSREQEILERQVTHLARLVDDLMDIARITAGKFDLQRTPCELSDVVVRAIEMASPLVEQRRHRVDLRVPRQGLGIDADIDRLAQVVSNLLTNAAKYSEPGARILVTGARAGDTVRLGVKDEGIGIAPEMMAAVFEPFVQQPHTKAYAHGGVGLGLAISRSLVTAHGGRIHVESQGQGHGSEFIVELPALGASDRGDGGRGGSGVARDRRTRVMVVDDNDDAVEMLRLGLEGLNYRVEIARDGPTALECARAFVPDIALLDIGLPGMDGYELARRLRELRGGGDHLRLVAVTGYGQDADRQRSARAGFERHLVKPIDLSDLAEVIGSSTRP